MLYDSNRFLLIAGPCALENKSVCAAAAEVLKTLQAKHPELQIIFKGSFDKANRTSGNSPRGLPMTEGLELLDWVKKTYQLPVLTDIHLPEQAESVGAVCDVLQIPAFLCRQTDLLVAAAKTGRIVNVKKGQFLSPHEMVYVVQKLKQMAASEVWQTERGYSFGYQNLVVDMRVFTILKQNQCPVIFDATHSVQLPGAAGGQSGGQREFISPLAKAACAAGAQGLFIETHPNPSQAISDAQTQIPLSNFPDLIENCLAVWSVVN